MHDDYRDYLRAPLPVPPLTPAGELALALGWEPVYHAPLDPPVAWLAPDGARHARLDWAALLDAVRRLRETQETSHAGT